MFFDDLMPAPAPSESTPAPAPSSGMFDDLAPRGGPTARITVRPVRPPGVLPEDMGEGPEQPMISGPEAFGAGLAQGASFNFGDELAGLQAAGRSWLPGPPVGPMAVAQPLAGLARLGYEKLTGADQEQQPDPDSPPVKGPGTTAYEQARDRFRAVMERANRQRPGLTLTGQVAGSLMTPGVGMAGATTRSSLALRGAATGGIQGGLSGIGEGEDFESRAVKGATGTVLGTATGAVAPIATEAVTRGARTLARPVTQFVRGLREPEAEAGRRGAQAVARAQQRGGDRTLTPEEFADAQVRGQPVAAIDMAGREGRTLARSVRNTPGADDGAEALEAMVADRFASQGQRAADFIDRMTTGRVGLAQIQERVSQANRPAYERAHAAAAARIREDANALWTPELQRLSGAPDIAQAMATVGRKEGNRSIIEGANYPRQNPFQRGEGPRMQVRENERTRAVPDLNAWDSVQRVLRGKASEAVRGGNDERARELTILRQRLLRELDRVVPEFQAARGTAFRGFRAEDAHEAGENYVKMNVTGRARRELDATIANMSGRDRVLFMHGFATRLIEDVRKMPDAQDVVRRIYGSQAARDRIEQALGTRRARELEAYMHVERVMNVARKAVTDKSTAAMQLLSAGAAGSLGYGALTGNWDWTTILAGAGATAGRFGMRSAEARLASRLGEMLSSGDPDVFARGVTLVARSEALMRNLRAWGGAGGTRAVAPQTTNAIGPQSVSGARPEDESVERPGQQ